MHRSLCLCGFTRRDVGCRNSRRPAPTAATFHFCGVLRASSYYSPGVTPTYAPPPRPRTSAAVDEFGSRRRGTPELALTPPIIRSRMPLLVALITQASLPRLFSRRLSGLFADESTGRIHIVRTKVAAKVLGHPACISHPYFISFSCSYSSFVRHHLPVPLTR